MSLLQRHAVPVFDNPSEPADAHPHTAEERCPWCDQSIPHEKFSAIRDRIAQKEREQHALMTARLKEEFAREKADLAAKVQEEAKRAAEAAMAARLEAAEAEVTARLKAADEARLAAEASRQAAEATLNQQRELLEQEKTVAVLAEQAKAFEERQKLMEKLALLQKQIENKTAQEIGEGPEADLFELLREAFEGDRIRRVAKGLSGADVIHEVVRNGQVCGKIVYDSKSRNAWKNDFVTKLRADQLAERAEHAILSCNKLPQGAQQIHVQDGVIVAHPQRVLVLAQILRRHVIETHELRVGNDQRDEKTAELYAFITSDRCKQLLEHIALQAQRMLELEASEERAHRMTWEKRGKLIRSVQKVHSDLCFEIERVIGTGEANEPDADEG
ncbi:DUF2130 domain-containing protein [Hyphomicrobium sp.]|uniref:DUF2130 domain-containing protein n=1 Tax=Hyphomicrobium sp. TaxID=82 RepID=UPI0025C6FF96|nr:DUF2130 domain-containing protein [Hyphomicrobium sp.]MCC7252628.1 DUF2130 domain-containing protein [Hyphomicrobium sp.]